VPRQEILESSEVFSRVAYVQMIEGLTDTGYMVVDFEEVESERRHLILRHDVDFDLSAAIELATLEAEHGWCSTYFVLLRTEFYNLFSAQGRKALSSLVELGRRVGLHFDAALYEPDDDLAHALSTECRLLEAALGQPVTRFSRHRPAAGNGTVMPLLPGLMDAYDPRFVHDIGYCSDSRGAWTHGHPLKHEAVILGRALQLLTHPIWWTDERTNSAQSKLAQFLARRVTRLDEEIAQHCSIYQPNTKNS